MNLGDIGSFIAKSAPLLGGVLGGPAGAAIGSIIAAKFGGDVNNPSELMEKIQADPQASLKLMEIQSNNELELQRLHMTMAESQMKYAVMQTEAENKERESARQREQSLAQYGKRDFTPALLAFTLTAGVFSALAFLFNKTVPEDNKELIVAIISALTTVWVGAMAYYHGSNAKDKDNNLSMRDKNIEKLYNKN